MTHPKPDPATDLSRDPAAWTGSSSGRATLHVSATCGRRVPGLQLDFDFVGNPGFVVARRTFRRPMPEDYVLSFRLRGQGPANDLEVKLVDAGGENVWRHVLKALQPTPRWRSLRIRGRDLDFAWGPDSGSRIGELGAIELAIVANEGGAGSLAIADLRIEDAAPPAPPTARASSEQPGFAAGAAVSGASWKPDRNDAQPWIELDLGMPREIGGLVIDWLDAAPPEGFRLRGSSGGRRWRSLHSPARAGGRRSCIYLPRAKLCLLRLELRAPCAGAALHVQSPEFSRSIEAFWQHIAALGTRGRHPRWLLREQSLWTPISSASGGHCALINEEGMVEPLPGSCSIEPMLLAQGRLYTWAQVNISVSLEDGWKPVPTVRWDGPDWWLAITAEATVGGALRLHYRLGNRGDAPLAASLFLLLRPFQVTPPWQAFHELGGVSQIHALAWRNGAVQVNDGLRVLPITKPTGFGAIGFDEGCITDLLAAGRLPSQHKVRDAFGFASGALRFELDVTAGASGDCQLLCTARDAATAIGEPACDWSAKIAPDRYRGQGWAQDAIHTMFTATAHILMLRAGAALQPGPRRYTRAWIRDAAMMGVALLRAGRVDAVRAFVRWYLRWQREDGFVPCCVDREGPDWLVEHDSHGELIALIAACEAFAPNRSFLEETWPAVDRAARCIERLIAADEHGLLPISASHEGYLAQPVHAYWDDFWALRGLRDAAHLAGLLGRDEAARHHATQATRLATALAASIEATRARCAIDYIPGSLELGDYDPSATANALALLGVPEELDRAALERTFDGYLARWHRELRGERRVPKYTAYEIRVIGALVRLGRRTEALELLRYFLADRRPPAWNQWPEIVWRDQAAPAHLGDLPHGWIAAEYVLALGSLFAYEREADRTLVLAAGVAPEWIDGEGLSVEAVPTRYGPLSYQLHRPDAHTLRFVICGGIEARLLLQPPLPGPLAAVTVNGQAWRDFGRDSVTINAAPAEVVLRVACPE